MMRALTAITAREFAGYFATPLAFVFIIVFLLANGLATFYLGAYFAMGQADLTSFFMFHPGSICFSCPPYPCGFGPKSAAMARLSFY